MNSINNRMTLSLCLLSLALLAACHAAQVPTEPAKPTSEPAKLNQLTAPTPQKDEDDDGWFRWLGGKDDDDEEGNDNNEEEDYDEEGYYGGDDSYDYDGEEEEETPEDELIELAMQHRFVQRDCLDVQEMINMAKNTSQAVDPELQQGFEECQSDLKEINSEMRALTDQITLNASQ